MKRLHPFVLLLLAFPANAMEATATEASVATAGSEPRLPEATATIKCASCFARVCPTSKCPDLALSDAEMTALLTLYRLDQRYAPARRSCSRRKTLP